MFVKRLKRAFVIALGAGTIMVSAQDSHKMQSNVSAYPVQTTELKQETPVAQLTFDYAFGDQIAATMNVPGATGKDWGIKNSLEGLEKFLKKNPDALKGKTVLAALGDCTLGDYLFRKNKLSNTLLKAVGNGRIVLMGVSEKRTDGLGGYANKKIKEFVDDHKDVMIFGGAIMPAAAKGEKLDPKRDYIYPETAEEFEYARNLALAALNNAAKPVVIPAKTMAPGK